MSISEVFIRRRVGTSLLAVGIILLGAIAYMALPVASLPQVDFPTIQISASLPGASAETMATTVATPLETSLSIVSGVTQMTSSSSSGRTSITMQFDSAGTSQRRPRCRGGDCGCLWIAAQSDVASHLSQNQSGGSHYTDSCAYVGCPATHRTRPLRRGRDRAAALSDVGRWLVDFHGPQRPSVRIRLDPNRLTQRGITLEDVRSLIGLQSVNAPKGSLSNAYRTVVLDATDQIIDVQAYKSMVVAYRNGAPIYLQDIGTVLSGPEDTHQAAWLQNQPSVMIDVHKQAGFNVLSTTQSIKDLVPALQASLPPLAS